MREVAVVVEGQTEERFISQVLGPHVGSGVVVRPIITKTGGKAGAPDPQDAPASRCHAVGQHHPRECVRVRAAAMSEAIPGDWLPFVALHEFETLVIASGSLQREVLGNRRDPAKFSEMIRRAGDAEHINDGRATAPSKRVEAELPGYRKDQDAIELLQAHDLGEVLELCPGFQTWVRRIQG